MTLQEKCLALAELKKKLDLEGAERARVKYSDKYVALSKQIETLMEEQDELLAHLPNSQPEYDALAQEVMDMMKSEGISHYENVKLKFRKNKSVDKYELLKVLDGDLDLYVALSNVTQKALTEHATGAANEQELMHCVKTTEVPVDVELLPSS